MRNQRSEIKLKKLSNSAKKYILETIDFNLVNNHQQGYIRLF